MTGREIEVFSRAELWGPFPYEDCFWLCENFDVPDGSGNLIPALDMFLADVVGFASSASRLNEREVLQLRSGYQRLLESFFERHPEFAPLEKFAISETNTPELARQLGAAERVRVELLPLFLEVLSKYQLDGYELMTEQEANSFLKKSP